MPLIFSEVKTYPRVSLASCFEGWPESLLTTNMETGETVMLSSNALLVYDIQ